MSFKKDYWAFLSYSHQDDKACAWLHESLERYRVPARLVGKEGRGGVIPQRLFPVFRDRDELPGSSELGANLTDALANSRYLIVLCSPAAARSRWVNEEIRQFKRMGGEERILALILDGEPNATDKPESGLLECFPEALRYRVDEAGEITAQRVEPIAADIRKGKESRQVALLKLVSGLLGVPFDELRQRDRERKRKRLAWQIAGGLAATAMIATAVVYRYRTERMERLEELGREALLKNQPTQAAVFLAEAYALGRSTPELRVMLDQAMRSVDALVTVHLPARRGSAFTSVAFDSSGARLAATTSDGDVINWRADNGQTIALASSPERNKDVQARFLDEGRAISLLTAASRLKLSSRDGQPTDQLPWAANFTPLAFAQQPAQGNFVLLKNADGEIRAADVAAGTWASGAVRDCRHTAVSAAHLLCTKASSIEISALAGRTPSSPSKSISLGAEVVLLEAAPTADQAIVVLANGLTKIIGLASTRSGIEVRHPGGVSSAALSRDGRSFVTGGSTGSVLIWSLRDGALLGQLPAHAGRVRAVGFTTKDERIVTVGEDNLIKAWDVASGALLSVNDAGHGPAIQTLVSPRGDQLVTYTLGAGGAIKVWDLTAAGPTSLSMSATPAAMRPNSDLRCDGRVRRQVNADGSLSILDPGAGAERLRLTNGVDTVEAELACDASMEWFITGGRSGAALLWNAKSGKPVGRFLGHVQSITDVSFIDSATFATRARDNTTARWAFEIESRSPDVISRRVACRVPYELDGYSIRPTSSPAAACKRTAVAKL